MVLDNIRYFELSENQKYMLHPSAIALFSLIKIKKRSLKDFEEEFRDFISYHPSLCTIFNTRGDIVIQAYVKPAKVKVRFVYELSINDSKEINQVLLAPFNVFDEEIIRVVVVENKNEIGLYISMPYAIIDAQSKLILSKDIKTHFDGDIKLERQSFSNLDFIKSQKKFLVSKEGEANRRYWREVLKSYTIGNGVFLPQGDKNKYVSQKFIVTEVHFEKLNSVTNKFKLPVTAIMLGFFQNLISLLYSDSLFFNVRMNGRDNSYIDLDANNFVGVMNNTLPIPVLKNTSIDIKKYLYECFGIYCEARMNQRVPFTVIDQDFNKIHNSNIDQFIAGTFNFNVLEGDLVVSRNHTKKNKEIYAKESIILNCYQHNNALELELLCLNEIYNKNSTLLDLPSYLGLFLKILE